MNKDNFKSIDALMIGQNQTNKFIKKLSLAAVFIRLQSTFAPHQQRIENE
jgi:hypothetical protein